MSSKIAKASKIHAVMKLMKSPINIVLLPGLWRGGKIVLDKFERKIRLLHLLDVRGGYLSFRTGFRLFFFVPL